MLRRMTAPAFTASSPGLNRKILDVALPRLRFCSIGQIESAANPGAILVTVFYKQAIISDSSHAEVLDLQEIIDPVPGALPADP
jgi:hypothetical protein